MTAPEGPTNWWYQTLVELAIPALYTCCSKLWQSGKHHRSLKQTRDCFFKAGGVKDIAGLKILLETNRESAQGTIGNGSGSGISGDFRGEDPLCLIRGSVSAAAGKSGFFEWISGIQEKPVICLSTTEICWKHFSARNVGKRVTYQIEKWRMRMNPFTVGDTTGRVAIPRLKSADKIDLRLMSAEKEPLQLSWGKTVYQALCRGRYAAHTENKEQALLEGSTVTALGRLRKDTLTGEVALHPEKNASFFITEKLPQEILEDLDEQIKTSYLTMVGLAATSAFFAGVLGLYLYVVGRDLYNSLRGRSQSNTTNKKKALKKSHKEMLEDLEDSEEDAEGKQQGEMICCICLTRKIRYVLVPCGHCCTCKLCSISLFTEAEEKNTVPRCPICRTEIDSFLKMYT